MNADSALAQLWVTPKCDGDIGLRMGGAQKFSKVEFTHLFEKRVSRSQIVNPLQNHYIRMEFHSALMRRLPSLVKGAGFRSLSRRSSRVQISPSAPLLSGNDCLFENRKGVQYE